MRDFTYLLQVRIPDPAARGFRLDVTALDSPTPLSSAPGEFRLGISTLATGADDGLLAPAQVPMVWFDLFGFSTAIRTSQGNAARPGYPLAPGDMSVTLRDCPDLDSLGVFTGTEIRLMTREPRSGYNHHEYLWWGWVESTQDSWQPDTSAKVSSINARDAVSALGNVTRYGARSGTPETLNARLERLLASSPVALTYDPYVRSWLDDDGFPQTEPIGHCEPTVMETSLLNHLNMAYLSNGLGARLAIDANSATPPDTLTARLAYTDLRTISAFLGPTPEPDGDIILVDEWARGLWRYLSYHAVTITSQDAYSVAELTNHLTDGTEAIDTKQTVTNPTAMTRYGARSVSLDVTADPNAVGLVGDVALAPWVEPGARPASIEIDAADVPAGQVDSLRPTRVGIWRLGRGWNARVLTTQDAIHPDPYSPGGVRHRITLTLAY